MKKVIMMMALMMCFINVSFSQLTCDNITTQRIENGVWAQYDSYVTKDGSIYKVGDFIDIGLPSTNGTYLYVIKYMILSGDVVPTPPSAANTKAEIKKIQIGGSKRAGFKVIFVTKGYTGLDNYYVHIEEALQTNEIKSNSKIMSSDEALIELKKWKDKLDLELITQDEYEIKKSELMKFIK